MNENTLLLRHVHPNHMKAGIPSIEAFRPSSKDKGKLSVANNDKIEVEEFWTHYTKTLESCGIWAVSKGECEIAELPAEDAPEPELEAHAIIDFNYLETRAKKKEKALELISFADKRGALKTLD